LEANGYLEEPATRIKSKAGNSIVQTFNILTILAVQKVLGTTLTVSREDQKYFELGDRTRGQRRWSTL
jgi:hypothetical protein